MCIRDRIGNHESGLIGADSTRLVVARQELDQILSRQQGEAGVVLDRTTGELHGSCVGELDVDVVADVGDGDAVAQVFDLAYEVNEMCIRDRSKPACTREMN